MNTVRLRVPSLVCGAALVAALAVIPPLRHAVSAQGLPSGQANTRFYEIHNLVSDGFVAADHVDPNLVNPWGLVFGPTTPAWVADNGTGVSTLYNGQGMKVNLTVTVPPPPNSPPPSAPTGIVVNTGSDFVVTSGTLSGPARFMFATEDGTISAWAPAVDATHAILEVNRAPEGAVYKGLALAATGGGRFLYATDFHNNRIDVFDVNFQPAPQAGSFTDPGLPPHFAPFGIQNILGDLYVTYAMQDADAHDDVKGPGLGFVDVYSAEGRLIRRFASRGRLNAPWGLALAPADFGRFSNALLVGNFGDGHINAYDLDTRAFLGQLQLLRGEPLIIDGLWAIVFGNGVLGQPIDTLFFTAGVADEKHGLYGRIDAITVNPGAQTSN